MCFQGTVEITWGGALHMLGVGLTGPAVFPRVLCGSRWDINGEESLTDLCAEVSERAACCISLKLQRLSLTLSVTNPDSRQTPKSKTCGLRTHTHTHNASHRSCSLLLSTPSLPPHVACFHSETFSWRSHCALLKFHHFSSSFSFSPFHILSVSFLPFTSRLPLPLLSV